MNKRNISLIFIIVAGEAIFMLPFLVPRLYRPLLLEAWNLTNTDIGAAFSAYGFSAMVSYIVGGPFADKYSPRVLMTISLVITASFGTALLFSPGKSIFILTYFFFGISTILLMWGALLKVTHIVGGEKRRSTAMGVLDGGRGLTAALMSSLLVITISYIYGDIDSIKNKLQVVQSIYAITIFFTLLSALCIWFALKNFESQKANKRDWSIEKAKVIFKDKKIWMLGVVILSAYCGYKSIDNYSVYLVDVLGISLAKSSTLTSILFWLRPFSAFFAGLIVDKLHQKYDGARFLALSAMLLLASFLQLFLALKVFSLFSPIFFTILISAGLAYALRAIYFSVFGDLKIPQNLVGTTVGIVSLVGYLPDLFFGSLTGYLIDTYPNAQGYSYTFAFTCLTLFVGSAASFIIYKNHKNESLF